MSGLSLADVFRFGARGGEPEPVFKGRSIVLLFLQGGPPQMDMFDPKMSAPAEYRTTTGEVQTKLPGITFGGNFPQLAAIADRLAVVRSYGSGNGSHVGEGFESVATFQNKLNASGGAIYAKLRGANHPRTGIPVHQLLTPEAVDGKLQLGSDVGQWPSLGMSGMLGPAYEAFRPNGAGELIQNLHMRVRPEQFDDRRGLLQNLDHLRRLSDSSPQLLAATEYQRQAFDVITRGAAEAFDLSREDPRTIARYDTSGIFDDRRFRKWKDMQRVTNLLGKQMLLARRLCEAGCGFVTVHDSGWDFHSDGGTMPKYMEGLDELCRQVDHAVRAFLDDVRARGLSDKIILVITGEMGRTPRLNATGGRDHWAGATPLLIAGGGLKMGQVVGRTDSLGGSPIGRAYAPRNVLATLMQSAFDVGSLRLRTDLPKALMDALAEEPIGELM